MEGTGTHGGVEARALIVDDDERIAELMRELLSFVHLDTRVALSGEEALELVREEDPSLVLLDVVLPGISGYEVCRDLRDRFGTALPIIFVSGARTEPLDEVAGLLIGADDYVTKPFVPDELLIRVRGLLHRKRTRHIGTARLTPRELEVLRLLADGLNQHDIAQRLVLSPKTVGNHIDHILSKLDVRSRSQAVAQAYRRALLG